MNSIVEDIFNQFVDTKDYYLDVIKISIMHMSEGDIGNGLMLGLEEVHSYDLPARAITVNINRHDNNRVQFITCSLDKAKEVLNKFIELWPENDFHRRDTLVVKSGKHFNLDFKGPGVKIEVFEEPDRAVVTISNEAI